MDPFKLLEKDHETVKKLFQQFEKARAESRQQDLFDRIKAELERHTRIEEQVLYPALKQHRAAEDLVNESYQEHHVVDLLIGEISALSPDDEAFEAKVTVLQENVEHHIEEEESELFKQAKKLLSKAQIEELGRACDASREAAPAQGRN